MDKLLIAGLASLLACAAQAQTSGTYGFKQPIPSAKLNQDFGSKADAVGGALSGARISTGLIGDVLTAMSATPTQNLSYAAGGLTNGVLLGAGGNVISYCPVLSCVTSPSADHQRTSALFWSTTSDDAHSEEQTVAIETIIGTGRLKPYAASTPYGVGDNVAFGSANTVYRAIQAGTTGTGGGPTGKGASIPDGSVIWAWINDAAIAAKVGLYNETSVVAGAGSSWAQANNVRLAPGVVPSFNINTEFDFSNDAQDCAIGVANCNAVEIGVGGAHQSTTGIHLSSGVAGPSYAMIWGLRLNGDHLAQQADIEVDSGANVGLSFLGSGIGSARHAIADIDSHTTSPAMITNGGVHSAGTIYDGSASPVILSMAGTHSNASIADASVTPAALHLSGTYGLAAILQDGPTTPIVLSMSGVHSAESINDTSTTPAALNLNGTYSIAAINIGATTPVALAARAGQKVCLNNLNNCISYDAAAGKFMFTNASGATIASLSDGGNMILSGTLTQNGTP